MSKSAKRLRRAVRRELRATVGDGMGALWAECAKLRFPARVRLAWRLVRGRAFDGKRITKGD